MATPLPLSNQTWLQYYERNVKSSPVNSLDISILIDQNTWKRSLNVPECCLLVCLFQPCGPKSMLLRFEAAPKQSLLEMRKPKVGALVKVQTGGVDQQFVVSNIKIATSCGGTLITIQLDNSEMTVAESSFVFNDCLILRWLGFFGDMALKRTTNWFQVWRDIFDPGKMINGEALMISLKWTIYGSSGRGKTRPAGVTKQNVAG